MSEPKLGEIKQLVPAYVAGKLRNLGLEPRSLWFQILPIMPVAPVRIYFFRIRFITWFIKQDI